MSFRSSPSRSKFVTVMVLFAACLIASHSQAQTFRGGINGVVTDQAGAVVAGAQVVAMADATRVEHATITSSGGEFSFQALPLGSYTVTATASGFQTVKVGSVGVTAGTI